MKSLSLLAGRTVAYEKCLFDRLKRNVNRGSYVSAHVLLNLLNKLMKRDKMRNLPSILSIFCNKFHNLGNTGA